MKERPASEARSWMWRRLRCAVPGFAPLRGLRVTAVVCAGGKEVQGGIGKSAGEWHFTLRAIPALTYVAFFLFCARHCFRTLPESAPQFDAEIGKKRNAG